MAKTLLLVRHGKSAWNKPGLSDHERPLLKVGIERTIRVARYLKEHAGCPDLIVSSHAVRAFETARLLAGELGYPGHEIQVESNLYFYGQDGLFDIATGLPDEKDAVMLVGHNPAMTQLANVFLTDKLDYLPTTGVVSIGFDAERWSEIPLASKTTNFLITPKMLEL